MNKALLCAQATAKTAHDKKAENVKILDLANRCGFTDYFVICSGTSDRQIQTIADAIQQELTQQGHRVLSVEGYAEGRWVLLDLGDVIVHIFQDALRDYYDLESLWAETEKLAASSRI